MADSTFGLNDDFGISMVDVNTGEQKKITEQPIVQVPPKVERKIDIGDGSGVQVFSGETEAEVLDKLTEAQKNATIKIRELSQAKKRELKPDKREPLPEFKPRVLSDIDIVTIQNEMATNPAQAFDKLFEAKVGATPDQIARQSALMNQIILQRQEEQDAAEFISEHDDYLPCPENLRAMELFMQREGITMTRNNLEYAFLHLKEEGKLKMPSGQQEEIVPEKEEIVTKPPVSLSDRSNQRAVAPANIGAEAAEIASLPMDKARERIVALMRQGGRA